MSKKIKTLTFGIVFLLISTACLIVTGSSDSKSDPSFKPYSGKIPKPGGIIAKVTLAKSVEGENFDPIDLSTKFGPIATIHAVATVKDAPDGTKFTAKWFTTDVGDAEIPNALIDEVKLTAPEGGGSGNLDFSLSPKNPLAEGNYRVEIYVNDKLDQLKEFSIIPGDSETDASSPTPIPSFKPYSGKMPKPSGLITKVTLAKGVEGENFDPVDLSTKFGPKATIHAVATVKDAPDGTKFTTKWFTTDVGDAGIPNKLIDEFELTAPEGGGSGNIDFSYSSKTPLPEGNYRVEIYVNDKPDQLKEFSIILGDSEADASSPTPIPSFKPYSGKIPKPGGIIAKVTMALGIEDKTFNPIDPTTEFTADVPLFAVVAIKKAPEGTNFSIKWLATDVGDIAEPNTLIFEDEITSSGTRNLGFSLSHTKALPYGNFRVEVSVNGKLDQIKEFSIVAGDSVEY